jgi:hypothetical protein
MPMVLLFFGILQLEIIWLYFKDFVLLVSLVSSQQPTQPLVMEINVNASL